MAQKVFVSYKYADSWVQSFSDDFFNPTTVRSYVDKFEQRVRNNGICVYKGERDGEDLSWLSEDTIWEKLKARIYDSTVTIVFISPNMRAPYQRERDQWIPWEISYSLREQTRSDRTSHANAILGVVLPDRYGDYSYYKNYGCLFKILESNIENGYIPIVKWNTFMGNIQFYINKAMQAKADTSSYKIVKSI